MQSIYKIKNLSKIRKSEGAEFRLVVPKMQITMGEKIALVGPSGCGKSTLLDILAMVLSPSSVDEFTFTPRHGDSRNVAKYWSRNQLNRLSELRKHHIGYVLQTGGLLPFITVRHNIDLSCKLLSLRGKRHVESVASKLGIRRHLDKLPAMLSVGERQRVAIARALIHRPSIIIADEPTASLDPSTAERIMDLMMELTNELGLTLIIASHDVDFMNRFGLRHISYDLNDQQTGSMIESVFAE